MKNLLYSLISFVIALFFILGGIVCFLIPWSSGIRTELIQFILEDYIALSLFGLAFVIIGAAIAAYILLNSRRHYYTVRSTSHPIHVDESIIEFYINSYWKQLFPDREIPSRITLKQNKISLTADLPYMPAAQQKPLLNRIKNDLDDTFTKLLGHHPEFSLFISFQEAPESNG